VLHCVFTSVPEKYANDVPATPPSNEPSAESPITIEYEPGAPTDERVAPSWYRPVPALELAADAAAVLGPAVLVVESLATAEPVVPAALDASLGADEVVVSAGALGTDVESAALAVVVVAE
jgi:hypothetical protein